MPESNSSQQLPNDEIIHTDQTLADLLLVSVSTVRRYRKLKKIGYFKPAGIAYFTRQHVADFFRRFGNPGSNLAVWVMLYGKIAEL